MHKKRGRFYREKRRADAAARNAVTAELSPEQRIAELDDRLGVGVGAVKERARLARKIDSKSEYVEIKKTKKKVRGK